MALNTSLSIPMRSAGQFGPVYGRPIMSSAPCNEPSSPGPPWQQIRTASRSSATSLPAKRPPRRPTKPPPAPRTSLSGRASAGGPSTEADGSSRSRDLEPLPFLRPVERADLSDAGDTGEAAHRLEAGQDRDVVLRRRTAVDDTDESEWPPGCGARGSRHERARPRRERASGVAQRAWPSPLYRGGGVPGDSGGLASGAPTTFRPCSGGALAPAAAGRRFADRTRRVTGNDRAGRSRTTRRRPARGDSSPIRRPRRDGRPSRLRCRRGPGVPRSGAPPGCVCATTTTAEAIAAAASPRAAFSSNCAGPARPCPASRRLAFHPPSPLRAGLGPDAAPGGVRIERVVENRVATIGGIALQPVRGARHARGAA